MNNSINWLGNKVLDPGASRQQPAITSTPLQQSWSALALDPTHQGGSASPMAPIQQGTTESLSVPMQQDEPVLPVVPLQQGRAVSPFAPMQQGGFDIPQTIQGPPPSTEKGYIPYYLASNIGRNVRAEFIIGTTQYADKTGVLAEVGINYFVLYDVNSRANIMCDLYSVKFVTILV